LLFRSAKIKIYRAIILLVVLYGCESWSLTLREECRLRVFENKVLRRIFGPKRDEVTGVEKTAQQGALCSVLLTKYHLCNQVKKTEMGSIHSMYGGEERHIRGFNGET
jgi:hypothetical protein